MTNDAFHPTAPQKEGSGLADCIRLSMEMAEVTGDDVGYVNAHGTGTPLNDSAEAQAYETAFRGRKLPIPISSTKLYFGHCLGAAGALEAAITIMAIRASAMIPTLRLATPIETPGVDWLRGEVKRQPLPLAMSASSGFGGSNTVLIFDGSSHDLAFVFGHDHRHRVRQSARSARRTHSIGSARTHCDLCLDNPRPTPCLPRTALSPRRRCAGREDPASRSPVGVGFGRFLLGD